jgi:hypothetical protein
MFGQGFPVATLSSSWNIWKYMEKYFLQTAATNKHLMTSWPTAQQSSECKQ